MGGKKCKSDLNWELLDNLKTFKYINKKTVEQISMYYYGEGVNIIIYCYICKKKVNVVTCYYKSQCSHM